VTIGLSVDNQSIDKIAGELCRIQISKEEKPQRKHTFERNALVDKQLKLLKTNELTIDGTPVKSSINL
jgi:hypothetical protein